MFKQIAAAAAAALSIAAPAAAQFEAKGHIFYEPSDFSGAHAAIVEQLYDIGVPVVDGRNTDLCPSQNVLGWYNGGNNIMVICFGDQTDREETLTHEAMHVVQDCRAGLSNSHLERPSLEDAQWWADEMPDTTEFILTSYAKEKWTIEIEAFYYETRPWAVSDDLSRACGTFKF